jgi:hypothetical protein
MKLSEYIYLSLSVVFFIIGVHQSFYVGISASYWLFMISGSFYLFFRYQRINATDRNETALPTNSPQAKGGALKAAAKKHRRK